MADKGLLSPTSFTSVVVLGLCYTLAVLHGMMLTTVDLSSLSTKYLKQGEVNPVPCVVKQKAIPLSLFPFFPHSIVILKQTIAILQSVVNCSV